MTITTNITFDEFQEIQALIYELAGITLSDAKQVMVQSRLHKRLSETRRHTFAAYIDLLKSAEGADERIAFINCLTTNKTNFFRENHHFEHLLKKLFPAHPNGQPLRIWSAACSTGEEPYSIAMCVREAFEHRVDAKILATDIDTTVLERAIRGQYTEEQLDGVSAMRRERFFSHAHEHGRVQFQVNKELRDLVTFRRLNFQDRTWPMTGRFDLIFCRNAMIYFNQATQRRLVERFASMLKPGGHLMIGHSESLHGISEAFELTGSTTYRLKSTHPQLRSGHEPSSEPTSSCVPQVNHTVIAQKSQASTKTSNVAITRRPQVARRQTVEPAADSAVESAVDSSAPKVSIIVGQMHASRSPEWMTTVLGSCIAACLYDETARVGGMNHFMLPAPTYGQRVCGSYGVHAMEMLINELMKLGADRRRLKAKLFGGGSVMNRIAEEWNIGQRNIDFAHEFLQTEKIPLVAEKIGAETGLFLRFHTTQFVAQVKCLDNKVSNAIAAAELKTARTVQPRFGEAVLLN